MGRFRALFLALLGIFTCALGGGGGKGVLLIRAKLQAIFNRKIVLNVV